MKTKTQRHLTPTRLEFLMKIKNLAAEIQEKADCLFLNDNENLDGLIPKNFCEFTSA